MADETMHLDQASLIQLLWLAAPCPGASESLLHLINGCSSCYQPADLPPHQSFETPHFSEETLGELAQRVASMGGADGLARLQHLVESCPGCSQLDHRIVSTSLAATALTAKESDWTLARMGDLETSVTEKIGEWTKRAPLEKQLAPTLCRQLLDQPQARRLMMIRNSQRYKSWPLIDLLCDESKQAGLRTPREAVRIAEIAVEIAESLTPEAYGGAIRADIGARAWAYLGNAHRVAEEEQEAEIAFARSEKLLAAGTLLDGTRAEVLYLRSYLEANQERFEKAFALVQEAREIYRGLGDHHMQGRMYLIEANLANQKGQPEEMVSLLKMAAQLTDPEREPRITQVVKQNLMLALADLERFEEAETLLPGVWEACRATGTRLDKLRLRWTEARIDSGLGRLFRAEITLAQIKEAFKNMDLPYEAALAGLELALLYSQQGRTREMKLLALEMLPVFARKEGHREALAAMTLFAKAAAAEQATLEVVEKALGSLREAASRPQ